MTLNLSSARLFALVLAAGALLLAGCGGGGGGAAGDDQTQDPQAVGDADVGDDGDAGGVAGESASMIELQEQDGSGLAGTAILTPDGEVTYFDIQVMHAEDPEGGDQGWGDDEELRGLAAEVRQGTCESPGETVQAVGRLEFGWGAANVQVPMQELLDGEHALVITRSETAAQEEEAGGGGGGDVFGGDDDATMDDDGTATAPADEDVLAEDREVVACGAIEPGGEFEGDETFEDGDS